MTKRVRRTVEIRVFRDEIPLSFPDLFPLLDPQTILLSVVGGRVQGAEKWHAANLKIAEGNELVVAMGGNGA